LVKRIRSELDQVTCDEGDLGLKTK